MHRGQGWFLCVGSGCDRPLEGTVRRWVLERWLSCAPTVAPWGCRPRRVAPSPARSRVTLDRESRKSGSSASRSRAGREAADGLAERVCAVHRGQGGREGGECERDGPARPAGPVWLGRPGRPTKCCLYHLSSIVPESFRFNCARVVWGQLCPNHLGLCVIACNNPESQNQNEQKGFHD